MNHFRQVLARGHVNIRVIAECTARELVKALEQIEAMRHDENYPDVWHERNRADLIHEIPVHFRALEADDTAQRHVENSGTRLLVFGINSHGKSACALKCEVSLSHVLLRAHQSEKSTVGIHRRWARLRRQQRAVRGGEE